MRFNHPGRHAALAGTLALAVGLLTGGGASSPGVEPESMRARPPRPGGAVLVVAAGDDLQARVDAAAIGSVLCLEPGVHAAPLVLGKRLTIWGPPDAVLRSQGTGSTIQVDAAGVELLGFTIDGSGGRFDLLDAAVRVHADDVRVEGLRIERALFGVLVEQSNRVTVRGNEVVGAAQKSLGLRGDGIRLWETADSFVEGNHVVGCRDVVVWYSARNRVVGNRVEGGRYGTHFMYSSGNRVEGNRYDRNVVGMFVMYSHDIVVLGNVVTRCMGAAGMGLGIKESGNMDVRHNRFVLCQAGIYLDLSPLQRDRSNRFEGNLLRMCETAVSFHSSTQRNTFEGNIFKDSRRHVEVGGGGDAAEVVWLGNYWDDYRGYDLDDDGVGDVPYELRSLATDLTSRYPPLAFLRGTPSLAMVDVAGQALPIFTPKTLLVDEAPLLRLPPQVEVR